MSETTRAQILIVHSYVTARRITRDYLVKAGFPKPAEASDGRSALDMMGSAKFDLVITASDMEPINGIQLVRKMRDDAALRSIPCLIILAHSDSAKMIEASNAGASNYIVWPFSLDELRKKVEATLARG